jgi:hypothetical protein
MHGQQNIKLLYYALIIKRIDDNNNNNNAIINNNCVKLQDLIVLLKVPIGTRKNFFEVYRQFGHAPLNVFASPVTDHQCAAVKDLQES